MARSLKKGLFVDARLLGRVKKMSPGSKTILKTWSRDCTITPEMVGFTFGVHNGREHLPVTVVENMVGHKLGEFSLTRKFVRHGGKMQKDIEAAAAAASAPAPEAKPAPGAKK